MKNSLILLLACLPYIAFSQVKVLTDNSVGVGNFVDPNTKFTIKNSDKIRGWYIFNQAFSSSTSDRIGIYNYTRHNTDYKQIGMKNELYVNNTSSEASYGIYNLSHLDGAGTNSAGIYNHTWTSATSTNKKIGLYNVLKDEGGTGNRYALYSKGGDYSGFFNGDVLIQGTLVQSSDRELKEDIQDIPDSIEKFKQLKARKYKLKKEKNKRTHYGFVAQEIEVIFPELVREFIQPGDLIYAQQENEQGDLVMVEVGSEPEQSYKSINYIEMLPLLVKVIQDQDEKISALEMRLEALEKKK